MSNPSNHLGEEKSPYLLQHKENPVNWFAWGEPAFRAARQQDKPIFLSIGYSTCHWCHVMAHQSFEDPEVAEYLNENFISIKVDREERPDVDDIYMTAVHAMGQRGGWPLSMFLTPELKPFFGGTYWPKENFLYILQQLHQLWVGDRRKALQSSESLIQHLREQKSADWGSAALGPEIFEKFLVQSEMNFDSVWGGFGSAPKFPHAMQLSMLLRIDHRMKSEKALQMTVNTLDKMARGGLYDHLGGGFARYSVDEKWRIPHFEKMLYDNALLAVAYLEAFQVTGISMFERVARETLDYILRVMTHPDGGFYSAEDADSEGEEGKFYVWSQTELHRILEPEEFEYFSKVYEISAGGNFEKGTTHFNLGRDFGWEEKDHPLLRSAHEKLFRVRETRVHPHKDDKILTAWNGLMVRAMAIAYRVTKEEKYLLAAHRAVQFIQKNLFKNSKLLARFRDGEGRFSARLEDYAFMIQGLIDLYQCDFNPDRIAWAGELQQIQNEIFWDREKGAYFNTDGKDPSLLLRTKEGMDGAFPNANAVSAFNLLRLHDLLIQPDYRLQAEKIFQVYSRIFSEYPQAFSQMAIAYDYFTGASFELALLLPEGRGDAGDFLSELQRGFYPHYVIAVGRTDDRFPPILADRTVLANQPTLYLCQNHTCQAPTHDWEAVLKTLSGMGTP